MLYVTLRILNRLNFAFQYFLAGWTIIIKCNFWMIEIQITLHYNTMNYNTVIAFALKNKILP